MHKVFLGVVFLLALAACHKDADTTPSLNFGAGDGFSYRTSANLPNGSQDATDWIIDTTWSPQEIGLFADNLSKLDLNASQQAGFLDYTAVYPNPGREAAWVIRPKQPLGPFTYDVQAMLVDHNYQRIRAFTSLSVSSNGYTIPVGAATGGRSSSGLWQ
ncbi:MAG: hypothetical protein EOO36_13650 [Cytophagaceae bacterium]|nr:MAG: hypothetical protein EOO36_13650 [Cytophagaceae bacterium]